MSNDYFEKHYGQLIGGNIIALQLEESDIPHQPWPNLFVEKGDDIYIVQLSRDPEGNGAGHAFIEKLDEADANLVRSVREDRKKA